MKQLVRGIALLGAVIFGLIFAFTYSNPVIVEEVGKSFIERQVEKEVREKLDATRKIVENETLGKLAEKLLSKNTSDIETIRKELNEGLHEKLADAITKMRDLSCECRRKYANFLKYSMELEMFSLEKANDQLADFIKGKYMEVVKKLTADIRVMTGSNFALFAIILLLSFAKPRGTPHLLVPGVLLLLSTLVSTYFYLFEQNWFFTIIYSDYIGFGYLVFVGILFLFLCDIALNKGRVTSNLASVSFDISIDLC